jgi:hypothetical protein
MFDDFLFENDLKIFKIIFNILLGEANFIELSSSLHFF